MLLIEEEEVAFKGSNEAKILTEVNKGQSLIGNLAQLLKMYNIYWLIWLKWMDYALMLEETYKLVKSLIPAKRNYQEILF